jgi:hypothetical protein
VRQGRLLRRLAEPARDAESGHPLIRSLEPGETWCFCFVDEVALVIPELHGETRIPPSPMMGG